MSESATCQLCGTSFPLVHDGTALQCRDCCCSCHDGWATGGACTSCHKGLEPSASRLVDITCRKCLDGALVAANTLARRVRRDCIDLEAVASRDPEASRAARDEMSRLLYVPAMPVVLCGRCRKAGSP